MSLSDLDKEIISILKEEKRLLFDEKIQLIKTTKSTILLLFPFLILSLEVASRAPALYLLLPFVISSIAFFLVASENTMNIIVEYISRLDQFICDYTKTSIPFFQKNIGNALADWKFNITKSSKHLTPNVYYLLSISLLFVTLPIYGYSILRGNKYLLELKYYWWNVVFIFLCIIFLFALIWIGIVYGNRFKEIRKQALDEMLAKFSDKGSK